MTTEWKRAEVGHQLKASVAPGLDLVVTHEDVKRLPPGEPSYNVIVFGRPLKRRAMTEEEGKARAIAMARSIMSSALDALNNL